MKARIDLRVYRVCRGNRSKWIVPFVLLVPGAPEADAMHFSASSSAYAWAKGWSQSVCVRRDLDPSDHRGWRRVAA